MRRTLSPRLDDALLVSGRHESFEVFMPLFNELIDARWVAPQTNWEQAISETAALDNHHWWDIDAKMRRDATEDY